jgi:Holliday junction resolvasome RuvABC endonuclease subunit
MDIHYIPPSEHKEALTGIGHADKQATIYMVQKKLGLVNMGNDEADAAALVLTWLIKKRQWEILNKIKEKYE